MPIWHWDLHKRKQSGGKRRAYRGKRRYESGGYPTETIVGTPKRKVERAMGGNVKVKLLSDNIVNVSDPSTGKTVRTEILRVVKNQSNIDYDRRGVLTKGAIVATQLGLARITSRPGQDGVLNAILIESSSR
ncbi:MAG: 30S ribosomal protein S8e [Candidatus Bathyarchaeia archaeon]|nr:30S ribosomal protein S8e [Candidatus Bathyarchaeota archaeon]